MPYLSFLFQLVRSYVGRVIDFCVTKLGPELFIIRRHRETTRNDPKWRQYQEREYYGHLLSHA